MKRTRLFLLLVSSRFALYRERQYSRALEAQLEGERQRNQAREDELMTVPMRMAGVIGLATRTSRAMPIEPLRRQAQRRPPTVRDAWSMLTEDERAEWLPWSTDIENTEGPMGDKRKSYQREFADMIIARRMSESGEIM